MLFQYDKTLSDDMLNDLVEETFQSLNLYFLLILII